MTDLTVNNIEDLQAAAASSLITPTQLGKSPVSGVISAAEVGGLVFTRGRFSGDVRLTGPLSETSATIGVLLDGPHVTVGGAAVVPGDIYIFPAGYEHEANYLRLTDYLLLPVEYAELNVLAQANGFRIPDSLLDQGRRIKVLPPRRDRLQAKARRACSLIFAAGDDAPGEMAKLETVQDLLLEFLFCLADANYLRHETARNGANSKPLVKLVRQAEEWAQNSARTSFTVDAMCLELGFSRRSFYRAFKDEMSLSPAQYLMRFRLSRVREELATSGAQKVKVSDIAEKWGFGDLGRFAAQYRSFFGENPSATVRK